MFSLLVLLQALVLKTILYEVWLPWSPCSHTSRLTSSVFNSQLLSTFTELGCVAEQAMKRSYPIAPNPPPLQLVILIALNGFLLLNSSFTFSWAGRILWALILLAKRCLVWISSSWSLCLLEQCLDLEDDCISCQGGWFLHDLLSL